MISNALLVKAFYPETTITVDAAACASATPEGHKTALAAMKPCHIDIDNDKLCNYATQAKTPARAFFAIVLFLLIYKGFQVEIKTYDKKSPAQFAFPST